MKSKKALNLTRFSEDEKRAICGGSFWTVSLAVSLLSSTVMNFIQLIFNLVNQVNGNNSDQSSNQSYSKSSGSNLRQGTLTSGTTPTLRLSSLPQNTTIFYQL
ncbi:MAG: hypothetical protein HUJ42_01980 [Malacoplasma sp.]|nr:hypothetical protein [Malacoplasma sp.]